MPPMFEPFAPTIDAFAKRLARNYREVFGKGEPDHAPVLRATAKLALERIAGTDALYHDALHTLFVADVGQAIELTRFPVPEDRDHAEAESEAGVAERLGYRDPADLAERYPRFFWGKVEPYIGPALRHLERTADGRLWVAQLYAHVFVEEHVRHRLGTERGGGSGELRVVAGEAEAPVARRQVPS